MMCILFSSSVVGPSLGGFLGDPETYFPGLVKSFPKLREVLALFMFNLAPTLLAFHGWFSSFRNCVDHGHFHVP